MIALATGTGGVGTLTRRFDAAVRRERFGYRSYTNQYYSPRPLCGPSRPSTALRSSNSWRRTRRSNSPKQARSPQLAPPRFWRRRCRARRLSSLPPVASSARGVYWEANKAANLDADGLIVAIPDAFKADPSKTSASLSETDGLPLTSTSKAAVSKLLLLRILFSVLPSLLALPLL